MLINVDKSAGQNEIIDIINYEKKCQYARAECINDMDEGNGIIRKIEQTRQRQPTALVYGEKSMVAEPFRYDEQQQQQ